MAGEVGFLVMHHVGDANSYVSIYRAGSDRVALVGEGIHFKTSTGEVLSEDPPRTQVSEVNEFLTGLYLQYFEHWFLRWLYVLGGLLGAVCIATGFIFFVEKRKSKHAKSGSNGSRVVDSLAVTTVTGMVMAALGMLVMNRSLFNPAWREQCWGVVVLDISAALLNWATTGDHLVKIIFTDTYWPVAGVDLSLLACAGVSAWAALKLALRESGVSGFSAGEVVHA